jgi:hypothetical protein
VKKILIFCFSVLAVQAFSQKYNDRSTTGPFPPKGVDVVGYVSTAKALSVTQLISGVPAYIWKDGCGPTVIGMLCGYFDSNGFPNLIPGDASTQTAAVNKAISSPEHYNDYALPKDDVGPLLPDKSELPAGDEHSDNCIADFMKTSRSIILNNYGWSKGIDIKPSWENYIANFATDYVGAATQYYYNDIPIWDTLVSNINRSKPMLLLVDTQGDGLTDHFVIVNGYKIENDIRYYGCFNTWDSNQHWYAFAQMASGVAWGVARCYTFSIHHKLPVAAGAISGQENVCIGTTSVDYTVPLIDDATSYIWTLPIGASGSSTTNTISVTYLPGAISGNITVKGHNANGDGASSSLSVTVNSSPVAPVIETIAQPTCSLSTGSVELSGLPSAGSWTITRTPGNMTYQGTGSGMTISGLPTGTFTFTVTNAGSCISPSSAEVIIDATPATPSTPVADLTQTTCTVSTGTIVIISPKETGMTYSIDGTTYTNTTGIFNSVSPGTYILTAESSSGCISAGTSLTINNQPSAPSAPVATLTQPSCSLATGTISITSPAGQGMTYSINGNDYNNTSGFFTAVAAGTYNLTAKSSSGCISDGTSAVINQQPEKPSLPVISLEQPDCSVPTGVIEIFSPKGTGYSYSIDGTDYTNVSGLFSSVAPGSYRVTAKNQTGCISTGTDVTINTQPLTPATPVITLTDNVLHSSSSTGNNWYNQDGIIGNATGQDYTVATSGIYHVIVTRNGCSSAASNTINVIFTATENTSSSLHKTKAYPNPFDNELVIDRSGSDDLAAFEIFNSLGKVVMKGQAGERTILETSALPRGIYILRVKNAVSSDHIKIIRK